MATRTSHPPGTFSWVDLTTSDAGAARRFYGELLGWEYEESELPGGAVLAMAKVGVEYVAAIPPSTDMAPPRWNSYVTVVSADETSAKAADLGATLIEQPFDIPGAGRMAMIQDPTGAVFCIWEPGGVIGATRVNDVGCLTWNELHTPDHQAAVSFYTSLFGWNAMAMPAQAGGPAYTVVQVGERSNGGIMDAQPGEPANWTPYFTVADRDEAAAKAASLGATEVFRMEMPQGQIAFLIDPQGAAFALLAGEVDD